MREGVARFSETGEAHFVERGGRRDGGVKRWDEARGRDRRVRIDCTVDARPHVRYNSVNSVVAVLGTVKVSRRVGRYSRRSRRARRKRSGRHVARGRR
jgi:hypothetical protein